MSGMDRLTIDDLQYWEEYGDYDVKLMARELLAHRRASQAAPAQPTEAMLDAARDWSDAKYGKPIGNDAAIGCWNAMLAAAPAPSDGLREAWIAGAQAVHAEWLRANEAGESPPRGDPEFGEAADDYASSAAVTELATPAPPWDQCTCGMCLLHPIAPSDALRDALATLLVQANGVEPRDDRLRQNVVRIARAALSTPTEERQ